jgi:hypothetical protein
VIISSGPTVDTSTQKDLSRAQISSSCISRRLRRWLKDRDEISGGTRGRAMNSGRTRNSQGATETTNSGRHGRVRNFRTMRGYEKPWRHRLGITKFRKGQVWERSGSHGESCGRSSEDLSKDLWPNLRRISTVKSLVQSNNCRTCRFTCGRTRIF